MIYVLGLGNVLMGDDGFGPAVVRAFEASYDVDGEVEIVDVGTPGLDLTPWLVDAEHLVIVDTVTSDAPPGTLRVYHKRDILRHAPSVRVGPHDPGVKEALLAMEFAGRGPREVDLIGIVPASMALSIELGPAVTARIPDAVDLVAATVARFGAIVTKRHDPVPPRAWHRRCHF